MEKAAALNVCRKCCLLKQSELISLGQLTCAYALAHQLVRHVGCLSQDYLKKGKGREAFNKTLQGTSRPGEGVYGYLATVKDMVELDPTRKLVPGYDIFALSSRPSVLRITTTSGWCSMRGLPRMCCMYAAIPAYPTMLLPSLPRSALCPIPGGLGSGWISCLFQSRTPTRRGQTVKGHTKKTGTKTRTRTRRSPWGLRRTAPWSQNSWSA